MSFYSAQEPGVKSARKQLFDRDYFLLTAQVSEDDRGVFAKLPDDLTTSTTRWRQRFRVCDDRELCKVTFAFGQRLPDGHAFGAHGQTIAGAFYVTTDVDLAALCSHCRADKEI